MKVIVDTAVWSLALRRGEPDESVAGELAALIDEHRVIMLGPIRQEVLSGYSDPARFERLHDRLAAFENEPIADGDYVRAAECHNACRRRGIQGAHTDFLVCACALRLQAAIYTTDVDFQQYQTVLPITLHQAAAR